ncbi:ABC transporter substrate-binding protein [Desertihabitans brevis]|uniref:ABC transporter substrate-binding protein n=1 Tax=Desertihabitans brevis TaxID=2268447 RepID=UPI0018F61E04|nr:sugar ABC transporter substrate-binding protein [Desertihabitans brevis]
MTPPVPHPLTRRTLLGSALGLGAAAAAGCSPAAQQQPGGSGAQRTVTVRLWDEQVEAAYRSSFDAFTAANPDIAVRTTLVPFADYFTKLTADVQAGNADDLFWLNGSYIQPYIDNGLLMEIGADFEAQRPGWIEPAVQQYTRDGALWGVPQLTDGGIAMYYNAQLLEAAGVTPAELADLTWVPGGGEGDTFLPVMQRLTVDALGVRADEDGFDGDNPGTWGYSAAQDLQGIYYNFLGSAGGAFQDEQGRFVFDSPEGRDAFGYLVDLINTHRVSPDAANTNDNGDFTRDQFLQGKIAVFQSGIYNLKNVADGADFSWGIVPIPAGPRGRVSVVNNVVVCGNAAAEDADAVTRVLQWLGSPEGAAPIGASGAALPAVTEAQPAFEEYWSGQDVDPSQFAEQGRQPSIGAPTGERYGAALTAWKPFFNEMFLGRLPVEEALAQAQQAANEAIEG